MTAIGSYTLPASTMLAPLSGCADLSFRLLVRSFGAPFCFFEMIDANALLHNHPRTLRLLQLHKHDYPIAAQLLGSHPQQMRDAAYKLLDFVSVPFIDINSACPVKKVLKKKAGAYLLKTPAMLEKIITTLTASLSVPITVKIRIGLSDTNQKEIVSLAQRAEGAGAAALFVHGRTQKQAYCGPVDYHTIAQIKKHVSIPVWGSGNILSPHDAKHMFDSTECDGVLVARGVFGNPWIFSDIEQYCTHGILHRPRTHATKIKTLKKHLAYVEQFNVFRPAGKLGFMRKIAQWYLTDFYNARHMRDFINTVSSYEELLSVIDTCAQQDT